MACPTPEAAQQIQKFIKEAGGNSTWDRLAEYLKKKKSNHEIFVINRSFDAPIETLYDAWTQPKHFSQWLGPNDTQMEYLDGNIQIGKTTFYKMSYSSGLTMYGKMTYIKMEKPNYLEYTQIFCNEQGQLSKHPLVPVWPDTMFAKVFLQKRGWAEHE